MSWPTKQSPLTNQLILWLPPLASHWSNKVGLTSTHPHYINPLTKHMETHTHTKSNHWLNAMKTFRKRTLQCVAVCWHEGTGLPSFVPQGNKEVKSPKSPLADIPTGGTRNIKSMWEKGTVSSPPPESPAPANKVRRDAGEDQMHYLVSEGTSKVTILLNSSRMWLVSKEVWQDAATAWRESLRKQRRPQLQLQQQHHHHQQLQSHQ